MKTNITGHDLSVNKACSPAAGTASQSHGPGTYNYFVGTDAIGGIPRPQSGLLTRREAATYLGVTEQTLAIWKSTGRYSLPCVKIGRLVKYRLFDLDAFIAKNLLTALPPVC